MPANIIPPPPPLGAGRVNFNALFQHVFNFIKSRANNVYASTCDGFILRMHYRWTFSLLFGGFLMVWYPWYHPNVITCASHFNAEAQVRLDYMNICLSYPYVEDDNGNRRYLLFYRWISWSLLLLAGIYYIPRKISKSLDNTRCKKLIEDLAANAFRYDQAEKELLHRAAYYITFNLRTHNGLYWKYLGVNVLALFVDIFAMQFLDFIFHGRFIQYGIKSFPFERDLRTFTDYMSQTFPPFVLCEISTENQLVNGRTEIFGCHLTIMELYEKLFLVLWAWLIILSFMTSCYIVFLLFMWLPWVQFYLLRAAKPAHASDKVRQVIHSAVQCCKIGDIYLLYRLKQHLSHARFYELMTQLSKPDLFAKQIPPPVTTIQQETEKMLPNKEADILRNRHPNVPHNPTFSPNYRHQLLSSPSVMARQPQHPNQQTTPPNRYTDILMK